MTMLYLGIGSNLGDRAAYLQRATELTGQRIGEVVACSRYYETEPRGFISDHPFLNAALKVSTILEPEVVLAMIGEIEAGLGRNYKGGVYRDRTIDIDILMYGDRVISGPGLEIPHPRMHERRFVLAPLAEIAGEVIHPGKGKRIEQLLRECMDRSEVQVYEAKH